MSTTVKVLDAKKEVAKYTFQQGEVLRIQGQERVNYQLIDNNTGKGPQNILTKRIGKDLFIMLDENNLQPDIIIENYYDRDNPNGPDTTNILVGEHENGRLYSYIPESGLEKDAVSMLAEEVIKPQALGGEELVVPFWIWDPWWVGGGLLAGGLIAALLAGGGGSKGGSANSPARQLPDVIVDSNDPTAPAKIIPPSDAKAGEKLVITYTNKAGQIVSTTATLGEDGKWVPENGSPLIVNTDGTLGLPSTETQQGSTISATSYTKEGNEIGADDDKILDPTPTPATVTIDKENNEAAQAVIKLPEDAEPGDEVVVTTIAQDGTTVTTTLTKQVDGTWKDNNPDSPLMPVDGNPNQFTVHEDNTKDGSDITVKTYNGSAPKGDEQKEPVESIDKAKETLATFGDPLVGDPTVTRGDEPTDPAVITPPADSEDGDKVIVTYTPPGADKPETITLVKKGNDWVEIDPNTGKPTDTQVLEKKPDGTFELPADKAKDNSPVSVQSQDAGSDTPNPVPAENGTVVSGDPLPTPATVTIDKDNPKAPAVIKLPEDAEAGDEVVVTTIAQDGTTVTTTLTKQADGTWTNPAGSPLVPVADNPNQFNVPEDSTKDGSDITVKTYNGSAPKGDEQKEPVESIDKAKETLATFGDPKLGAPNLTPPATPTDPVVITPPTENAEEGDKVIVEYTPKGSTDPVTVTLMKKGDEWVEVDPTTNEATDTRVLEKKDNGTFELPASKTKDGSPVKATPQDVTETDLDETRTVSVNSGDPAPSPATVTIDKDNNPAAPAVIKLPEDAEAGDEVVVTTIAQDGTTVTTTLTKQADGTWKNNNPDSPLEPVADNPNQFNVPEDSTKDGSNITVETYNGSAPKEGENKEPVEPAMTKDKQTLATFGDPPVGNPSVTRGTEPTAPAVITPPADSEDGDKVIVTYTPPGATDTVTVTLKKNGDDWVEIDPNTDKPKPTDTQVLEKKPNGTFELPEDKTKDGSPVSVQSQDAGSDTPNPVPAENGTVVSGDPLPAPATVTIDKDNNPAAPAVIKLPEDAEAGDEVVVTTIAQDGTTVTTTLTKQPDGTWTNPAGSPLEPVADNPNQFNVPEDSTKDGSDITVKTYNGSAPKGNEQKEPVESIDKAKETLATFGDPEPSPATVTVDKDNDPKAPAMITLPNDAEIGDEVVVTTIAQDGTTVTTTLTKTADGWTNPQGSPLVPVEGKPNQFTVPEDSTKDGSNITVATYNGPFAKNKEPVLAVGEGNETTATFGDPKLGAPNLTPPATPTDPVVITPPTENVEEGDKVIVEYTPKGSTDPVTVTLMKKGNEWVEVDPTTNEATNTRVLEKKDNGTFELPASKTKDGSPVKATPQDVTETDLDETRTVSVNSGDPAPSPATVTIDGNNPEAPAVISLPNNAEIGDEVVVTTIAQDGTTVTTTLTKTADGWTNPQGSPLVPVAGNPNQFTVPENKTKDGSTISVDTYNGSVEPSNKVPAGSAQTTATFNDPPPAAPTVETEALENPTYGYNSGANTRGNTIVTTPADDKAEIGDKLVISYTSSKPDAGGQFPVESFTLVKTATGWAIDPTSTNVVDKSSATDFATAPRNDGDPLPIKIVNNNGQATITLRETDLKDGTPVNAKTVNAAATVADDPTQASATVSDNASNPVPSVIVSANTANNGTVITLSNQAEIGDKVQVTLAPLWETEYKDYTLEYTSEGWKPSTDMPAEVQAIFVKDTVASNTTTTVYNIADDSLIPASTVTAQSKDAVSGLLADASEANQTKGSRIDAVAAPTDMLVTETPAEYTDQNSAANAGGMTITPGALARTLSLRFTKEVVGTNDLSFTTETSGEEVTINLTRNSGTGAFELSAADEATYGSLLVLNADGTVFIKPNVVVGGTAVTAVATRPKIVDEAVVIDRLESNANVADDIYSYKASRERDSAANGYGSLFAGDPKSGNLIAQSQGTAVLVKEDGSLDTTKARTFKNAVTATGGSEIMAVLIKGVAKDDSQLQLSFIKEADEKAVTNRTPKYAVEVWKNGVKVEQKRDVTGGEGLQPIGYRYEWYESLNAFIGIAGNVIGITPGVFKEGSTAQLYDISKNAIDLVNLNTASPDEGFVNKIFDYGDGRALYTKTAGGYVKQVKATTFANADQYFDSEGNLTVKAVTDVAGYDRNGDVIAPTQPLMLNEKEVELDDTDNAVSYSDYFGEYGFSNQDGVVTKLHFGKGNDTLYLDQDGVKVSTAFFSSLEKIEATADNVTINVKAADLVANNSEIPLHINGDSSTTVDLGANNATTADNANVAEESTANLTDADGVWQKQASVEENDTAYDVYRHSTTEQEVYVQQGVEVI